jgi:Lactonase, 7-bladed beta-propeller
MISLCKQARKWIGARCLGLAATMVAALVSSGSAESALAQGPPPVGRVYTQSNDPAGNSVLGYRRASDGSLTPLPGSPFPTGGLGIGPASYLGPYDSDQNLISNLERTLLFVVNGGSDSIAVLHIRPDGSLVPVEGSPFYSGGSNPCSVGLAGRILCVVNKDMNPENPGTILPNYTTFRVTNSGQLDPIRNSTYSVDQGASPTQALTMPSRRLLFGADFLGGILRSFRITGNGALSAAAAIPLPPQLFEPTGAPALPIGLAVHPTQPILYVGFVTINQMGVYRYDNSGTLTFLTSVPSSGNGICWITVDSAGKRAYSSNTGDASISVYDTTNPSQPFEIQKLSLNTQGNSFQFGLDSTGSYLDVITQRTSETQPASANALHVLSVDSTTGKVTEVPSSPTVLPVNDGVRPEGVVAF